MTTHVHPSTSSYFVRESPGLYRPTLHVGGGWNPEEQHIAPVIGLIAHELETHHRGRRNDVLPLVRLSVDILGVIPMDAVRLEVEVIRPGRTIELLEVTLSHGGRPAVIARGWLSQRFDTADVAHSGFDRVAAPEELASATLDERWPGGFVRSLDIRRESRGHGRALSWVRPRPRLIDEVEVSPVARLLGAIDVANGLAPLAEPHEVAYPNLDFSAHLFRDPVGEWIGLETRVSFGDTGAGLTHSILHDGTGPLGSLAQVLTVRPLG